MILLTITLVCILIGLIEAFIYHNSEDYRGEPCTMSYGCWIMLAIGVLIPILNAVIILICAIGIVMAYVEEDMRFKKGSWLSKRY